MEGYRKIIEKLLADNALECRRITDEARKKAQQTVSEATASARETAERAAAAAKIAAAATVARRLTVAELDVKKALLAAKKDVVDGVFSAAASTILAWPKARYQSLIRAMLVKCADDGDEVVIAASDRDRISAALIKEVAVEKGIRLTLAKDVGTFSGGLILRGKNVDKNVTLDIELAAVKEELETEVNKRIFG